MLEEEQLTRVLSVRTRILESELAEFHSAVNVMQPGVLKSTVKGTHGAVTITANKICEVFELRTHGAVPEEVLSEEDLSRALQLMGYTGNKPSNLKKVELTESYRFLADIIGKVRFCKTSAHDAINREMFCLCGAEKKNGLGKAFVSAD